jgi:biotin operon repressor
MNDKLQPEFRFSIMPEWILHATISDKAVRLYGVLARFADNQTHEAFPSRETLAEKMGCSSKSIDRAATELVELGAITKRQRHNSSLVYTLMMSKGVGTSVSLGVDKDDQGGWTPVSRGVDTSDDLTITTELEPEELEPLNTQTGVNESFNEFWDVYPKHLQKGEARKAFFKAVNRLGDASVILEGARRMAADPNLPVKQFIPYPATWLNREGWEDEPFPVREGVPGVEVGLSRSPVVGEPRAWVREMHDMGEHFECKPGEFGCR